MNEIYAPIHKKYLAQLKNLDVAHPKIVICFSSVPGAGKSTIAKALEEKLQGIRIENDAIREIVSESVEDLTEMNKIVFGYVSELFAEMTKYPNGLLIIDASIDRVLEKAKQLAQDQGYLFYIIRLEIPDNVIKDQITARGNSLVESHFKYFDQYKNDYITAGENMIPNYIITTENRDNIEALVQNIQSFISSHYGN